jgi:hypothetical protein
MNKNALFVSLWFTMGLAIFSGTKPQASHATNTINTIELETASIALIQEQFGDVEIEFQVQQVEYDHSTAHIELHITQHHKEYGTTTELIHIYAIYDDGEMEVIFREPSEDYFNYADQIPEIFLPKERLNKWLDIYAEEQRLTAMQGGIYNLPFTGGSAYIISRGGTSHSNKYDFAMTSGTLLRAARGGQVIAVFNSSPGNCYPCSGNVAAGNYVRMIHPDNTYGTYFHLLQGGQIFVNTGQFISQGACLGYSGNTGNSTGPHLHFAEGVDAWGDTANLIAWTEAPSNNPYLNGTNFWSPNSQNSTNHCTDFTAPTVTSNLAGTLGQNNWYTSNIQVTLSAQDNDGGTGVKNVQYHLGSGNWEIINGASANFTINTEGVTTVQYRSEDNAGNVSSSQSFTALLDKTIPTASNALLNNGSLTTQQVNVNLQTTATDGQSGLWQMRLSTDGGGTWSAWRAFQPSLVWNISANNNQSHTIQTQVRDRAGHISNIVSDSIVLVLYPERPTSVSYRLCASNINASGQTGMQSSGYRLTSSIGNNIGGVVSSSSDVRARSGFLASVAQCRREGQTQAFLPLIRR